MRNEKLAILLLRGIPSVYRRIRSKIYSFIFNTKNLNIGRNVTLSGTNNFVIGNRVLIGNQSWIDAIGDGKIIIGDEVSLSQNVHVAAKLSVKIGNGCLIGSDVLITDHNHGYGIEYKNIVPKKRELVIKGHTEIGDNCWIGDNVKILSGVTLGCNVIVGANSVVTKSFPSNCIVGGIPAQLIKSL
jgi:lipopolysaccharide O-acetyltransferase